LQELHVQVVLAEAEAEAETNVNLIMLESVVREVVQLLLFQVLEVQKGDKVILVESVGTELLEVQGFLEESGLLVHKAV
jgi:hypothetical protein